MKIIKTVPIKDVFPNYSTFQEFLEANNRYSFSTTYEFIARAGEGHSPSNTQLAHYKTQEYFDKTNIEILTLIEKSEFEPIFIDMEYLLMIRYSPYPGVSVWFFKGNVYEFSDRSGENFSESQKKLLVLEYYDKDRKKWEKLNHLYVDDKPEDAQLVNGKNVRQSIPEKVRIEVWRRDEGKCARCGSRERLEYDHIVPVSRGGANTTRNIELLCEKCNREKFNNIQ